MLEKSCPHGQRLPSPGSSGRSSGGSILFPGLILSELLADETGRGHSEAPTLWHPGRPHFAGQGEDG